MLEGLAYRILGSRAEAEDAVQDTWLKWEAADRAAIERPAAWLVSVCTRRCVDLLRSAHKRRVDYVGPWLPEPIRTDEADPALGSSLTTAFLLVLERLTPKERAAYLLHEIFEVPYADVAASLEMQEAACRKLVSRARGHVGRAEVRHVAPRERQEELVQAFTTAIADGDVTRLSTLLSDDVTLSADSGGKVPAIREPLRGKAEVLAFVVGTLHRHWSAIHWEPTWLNGALGGVVRHDGEPVAAVSFAFDGGGRVIGVFVMRNPDKLRGLGQSA